MITRTCLGDLLTEAARLMVDWVTLTGFRTCPSLQNLGGVVGQNGLCRSHRKGYPMRWGLGSASLNTYVYILLRPNIHVSSAKDNASNDLHSIHLFHFLETRFSYLGMQQQLDRLSDLHLNVRHLELVGMTERVETARRDTR